MGGRRKSPFVIFGVIVLLILVSFLVRPGGLLGTAVSATIVLYVVFMVTYYVVYGLLRGFRRLRR